MEWATVLTSRAPERIDELDINAGDFVKVLQKFNDGWFKGSLRGNTGLAPMTHVRFHRHLFAVRVEHEYEPQLPDELYLGVGDVVKVLDDDLEDAGWWLGEVGGKVGLFPNNFVQKIQTTPMNQAVFRKKARSSAPAAPPAHLYEEICQGSGDKSEDTRPSSEPFGSKPSQVQVGDSGAMDSEVQELKEELARIRFGFEWFSMRHAKTVSQLVDEIEEGKKMRKQMEKEVGELAQLAAERGFM